MRPVRHAASRQFRRPTLRTGLATAAFVAALALGTLGFASLGTDRPGTASAALPSTALPSPAADTRAAPSPAPEVALGAWPSTVAADPTQVRVPRVGIDSSLIALGLDPAGALQTPTDFAQAGWFAGGTTPGDVGPAVLAGHVDSTAGPAVFWALRELLPGDEVLVDRADGTTARFVVTDVQQYPKTAFPTAQVYGPTPDAQLRLITCGGSFDRSVRSYRDNIVVFARLA